MLGAALTLADTDGVVLTGRLSPDQQPWLVDHVLGKDVTVPGTAFVELAIRAGDQVGCGRMEELTLGRPLVLPGRGAAQIQVAVGAAEEIRNTRGLGVLAGRGGPRTRNGPGTPPGRCAAGRPAGSRATGVAARGCRASPAGQPV